VGLKNKKGKIKGRVQKPAPQEQRGKIRKYAKTGKRHEPEWSHLRNSIISITGKEGGGGEHLTGEKKPNIG